MTTLLTTRSWPTPIILAALEAWNPSVPVISEEGEIPPFEERLQLIRALEAATRRTLEAGVPLPFEGFVRARSLDLLDRLLFPGEPGLPAGNPFVAFETVYPAEGAGFLGIDWPWWLLFLVFFLLFLFALRRPLRAEF